MDAERAGFRTFWLIVGGDGDRPEVFELGADKGTRMLPVFSFEEEAMLFLRLGGLEGRWRVGETGAADLASTLTGAHRGVIRVVLDPFPEIGFARFYEVFSLGREEFVALLILGRRFRTRTARGPSTSERRASMPPGTPSEGTSSDR
ncbi:MAG: hypothetical protein AVDCRST_MAG58-2467 [uncultured Rubrobacteraceae bacterium]|uniref:Uncharacterized protein n=1 Tax=uncultured Rubrobacteraceae bacterium TaxID=349277 RepID=A0A6J4R0J1_9ACTN|nr:MAG: hypothetical protein AVDCRST_MAG58-2467 [uncultured Rubrobacteraceae bacterium]